MSINEIITFVYFLRKYLFSRLVFFGLKFEKFKDVIVALLVVKRGKYSSSFLNTSFIILVLTIIVGAPAIAENNPFTNPLDQENPVYQSSVITVDPFENPVNTVFSIKPRDKVEQHTVSSGETLASIAKKFDVSVDSIKWANDLDDDTIKPGDKLKIPPVTGVVHKVAPGDNIYSLAKKYKTDAQKIVNFPFNDFSDLETFQLSQGQNLVIPDGIIEEEQPRYEATQQNFARAQAGVQGTSSFIWPTSGIVTQYAVWYHMALDIANNAAPAILAADTGTATYAGCIQWGYGCHVIIDHGNGFRTLYAHMAALDVSIGQTVTKGQRIGTMGSTGRSTGTHVHFEIYSGGVLQNPLNYLQ